MSDLQVPWNKEVEMILGRPNFWCAGYAHRLVKIGHKIPEKSEAEQAYVIHWMLNLYLKHGDKWADAAQAELTAPQSENRSRA